MADINILMRALRNADKAGDVEAAKRLATLVYEAQEAASSPNVNDAAQPEDDTTIVGDLARGAVSGFASLVPLATEGIGALAYATGVTEDLDNALVRWGRQSQKDIGEFFGGDKSSVAYGVGNALGSFASFFVPGVGAAGLAAKGLATAAKITKIGGTGGLAVGAGAGEQAQRIINLAETMEGELPGPTENLKAAIVLGGAVGIADVLPVRFATALVSKGVPRALGKEVTNKILANVAELATKTAPRRIAGVGVAEGSQEALAGYLQDLTEKGLYNPDLEIGESVAADFGYGGSAGAIFQTGIELMLGRRKIPATKEDAAREQLARENAAAKAAAAGGGRDQGVLGLPSPPLPLLLTYMNKEKVLPDANIAALVNQTVEKLGANLPLSFSKGSIVTTDAAGTPNSYNVIQAEDGIFVASSQGVRVSPNFSSSAQAEEFRALLNDSVNQIIAAQDELETDRLARDSLRDSRVEETSALLGAAKATINPRGISFGELSNDVAVLLNARRLRIGQKPLTGESNVTIEELSDSGASLEVIDSLLPDTGELVTVDNVLTAAESKNILVEDAGFERFASRFTGSANIKNMSPTQLSFLFNAIENIPRLPGSTPQSLPFVGQPEFTGPQYTATIALANRKGEEGFLKSEVSENLDMKRGAPTESLIKSGVARGDLKAHPTLKNRWVSVQFYEANLSKTLSPFEKGEVIDAKARAEEERVVKAGAEEERTEQAIVRAALGQGIIIPTTREEGDKRDIRERSEAFKKWSLRLAKATTTSDVAGRSEGIRQSVLEYLKRFAKAPALKGMDIDFGRIGVEIIDSIKTEGGKGAEGSFKVDPQNGRIVITLAADLSGKKAKTDAEIKEFLVGVFNHEVIHALKKLGVISDADMALLVKYAKNSRRNYPNNPKNKETFFEYAKKEYTEENLGRKLPEEEIEEEAVADAFRYWAAGDIVTGKPLSIFNRIVTFFRGVSSGLTKADITSAEQIFNNLRAPEDAAAPGREVISDFPPDALDPPSRGLTQKKAYSLIRETEELLKFSLTRIEDASPTDEAFSNRDPKHNGVEVAKKPLSDQARRLSILDILYSDLVEPRSKKNLGYVARLLKSRGLKVLGGSPIIIETDKSKDGLISDALAAEAIAALNETGNALNWYSEKVAEAVETASMLYPEIATDKNAKFAFLTALAVTSQNTNVTLNAEYSTQVYDYFRENGRFPEDFSKGKHGPSMAANFVMLNELLNEMGPDRVRTFFSEEYTVGQLKALGYKPPQGENQATKVYGSYLLGPKIGQGFYQNLIGNFEPVTIDMWLMRTFGRMTGLLVGKPDIIQKQVKRLIEGLRTDATKRGDNAPLDNIFTILEDFNKKDGGVPDPKDIDAIVELADKFRLEHDRLFKSEKVQDLYRKGEYKKPLWAKAAEAIVTQQSKPQGSPSGGNFRNAVRRIMGETRKKLADSGYDVTMADLQAILWYPEKNLYKKLGVRIKDDLNIDYAKAFKRIIEQRSAVNAERNVLPTVGGGVGAEAGNVEGRNQKDGQELGQAKREEAQRKFSLARKERVKQSAQEFKVTPEQLQKELDEAGGDLTQTRRFKEWFRNSVVTAEGKGPDYRRTPMVVVHATTATSSTGEPFSVFNTDASELGSHFGSPKQASDIVTGEKDGPFVMPGARSYPVYLSIQNPLRLLDFGEFTSRTILSQLEDLDIEFQEDSKEYLRRAQELLLFEPEDSQAGTLRKMWLNKKVDAILRDAIKAAGYDGVVYLNRREGIEGRGNYTDARQESLNDAQFRKLVPMASDSYIAFEPSQIKSVFNRGTFDPAYSSILYSLSPEQLAERENVDRYNRDFKVPSDAYAVVPLREETARSKSNRDGLHRIVSNGKELVVYLPRGFDTFSKTRNKTVGFGQRHMKKHDVKASRLTKGTYNSIADIAATALDSYWPVRGDLRGSQFEITEVMGPFGNPQIRMEWRNNITGYPAILLFEPLFVSTISPDSIDQRSEMANTRIAILRNGFLGASDGRNVVEIPQAAIALKERTAEIQRSVEIGMADAPNVKRRSATARDVVLLKKKYSLAESENKLSPELQNLHRAKFAPGEDQTIFERILSMFGMSDTDKRSVRMKIRNLMVDKWGSTREIGKQSQKIVNITADAQTNSAISQHEIMRGIIAAALRIGPLVKVNGLLSAINENIVENMKYPEARAKFVAAFDRLQNITRYIEPDGTVVEYKSPADLKGLLQIFSEITAQNTWAQFNLYAGAKRANRLMTEGREKTWKQEEIDEALKIGDKEPSIIRAYRQYQLWNNALISLMQDTGVISDEAAQLWRDNADYLPFYREAFNNEGVIYTVGDLLETNEGEIKFVPDNSSRNNRIFDHLYNVKAPQELKGGKVSFFVMVNDVADTRSYMRLEGDTDYPEAARVRRDELRNLNPNATVKIVQTNQRIGNPTDNILRNLSAAVSVMTTNMVASRAVRDLFYLNLAKRVPSPVKGEPSPNTVGIRVKGKTVYYQVQDEFLVATLGSSGEFQMPGLDLMAMPARMLRELVTRDPGFMAAALLRDTVSSWVTSGINTIPGLDTLFGFVKAITNDPSAEVLEATGVVGGYDAKRNRQDAVALFKRETNRQQRGGWNPVTWWDKWGDLSQASDTAQRVAVFNRVLKDTNGDIAAAIVEALDVINFSRKGSSPFIRYFTAVVPFMNARIQGLDLIYRSATRGDIGTTSTMSRSQRQRRFYMRALSLVALSAAYSMASDDDDNEWYKNATEVDKDNYWIIPPTWFGLDATTDTPAIKIPIPFEVGVLFKVIPERIIRAIRGETGMDSNQSAAVRHIMGTFGINPIPQFMLPLVESALNKDFFTGRPVVTYWDERNAAWLANPDFVSPLAIEVSKGVYDTFNISVDAEKIDHMVRGYTGTLGSYALMVADSIMRTATGMPERPAKRLDQYPVLGRFLQENQGTGPVQAFYDLYNEVMLFTNTINKLEREGRLEDIDEYINKRQNVAIWSKEVKKLAEELKKIRAFRAQVSFDSTMSSKDKTIYLNEIQTISNELVSQIIMDKDSILHRTD